MAFVDPVNIFTGVVVIAAPHMDDEVLACGGTIARLPQKERIHCIYATDGSKSPVPPCSWLGSAAADLSSIRMQESRMASSVLGIPEQNLHFLQFPDGELASSSGELRRALTELFEELKPSCVLIPFRYDRHPDHIALNRAVKQASEKLKFDVNLVEYFVYYRWKLLPGRDLRRFIHPDQLLQIDIQAQATKKQRALECFASQTTLFYHWQHRPIIGQHRLAEVSQSPECFVKYDQQFSDSRIFARWRIWTRVAHRVEPVLKEKKDQILTLLLSSRLWRR